MVLKWTRTKPEPLKYFEQELILNPNRYLKRFDTLELRYCTRYLQAQVLQKKQQGLGKEGKVPMPPLEILVICFYKIVILVTSNLKKENTIEVKLEKL